MIKNTSKQTGSAHVVIIVILVIVLLGALGFVFWQNFAGSKDDNRVPQVSQATKTDKTTDQTKQVDEGYLVLQDWKVKFKLPENAGEIHYYKKVAEPNNHGVVEYYEFSTKRVEQLGEQCVEPNSQNLVIRLAMLSRSQLKREDFVSSAPANDNIPIDGFYYVASGGNSICADSSGDIQKQDRDTIYEMLLHPIAL